MIMALPAYFESFIGAPLTAFISASVTLTGKVITAEREGRTDLGGGAAELTGAGPEFVATLDDEGFLRLSSPELQLEAPKTATSDNTSIVEARRAGVHNVFSPLVFFINGINALPGPEGTQCS
jgi:hypothetical protein